MQNPQLFAGETDWEYSFRREMQEIIPGLFLGPYASVSSKKRQQLIDLGITHIVCVRGSDEAGVIRENFKDIFKYFTIDLDNNLPQPMIPLFKQVNSFIDDAFRDNGKILVHGNNGSLLSPTFVIAYIIARTDMNAKEALKYVMKRRFCVYPPEHMMQQLDDFVPISRVYFLPNDLEMRNTVKRKIALFEAENCESDKKKFSGSP